MSVKITTLIENKADLNSNLYGEHGLSLYIEADGINIIFDTGQSDMFIKNAKKLNINMEQTNYVILSHGHYDHSGGFISLVKEIGNSFKLIISYKFFNKKFSCKDNCYKFNGNSFDGSFLNDNNIDVHYINEDMFYISENIIVFSNFTRETKFEKLNNRFFVEQEGKFLKDTFLDEIVVAIKQKDGLLVILGCSHIGIVNILQTIMKRMNMPIYGIIGGTHLIEADEQRLMETINYFKEIDIKFIGVSHCTGEKAIESLKSEFKTKYFYNNTGNVIEY